MPGDRRRRPVMRKSRAPAAARPGADRAAPSAFALSRSYRASPLRAATPAEAATVRAEAARHVLELSWDGHRVLACRAGADVRLVSADLRDWATTFPAIATAVRGLAARELVLDGFVCALDERGRPAFERLRSFARAPSGRVVLALWDALAIDGEDLRGLPLLARRARLAALLAAGSPSLVLSERLRGEVDELLARLPDLGVPGLVARREESVVAGQDDCALAIACAGATLAFDRSLSPPPAVTNADKVLFARDGITKRDAVDYYAVIAPFLLPHLGDRPVVCQRWPDGIDDFTWYQHRVPPRAPDYLRAAMIEGNRRIVVDNRDALLWLVNQAALTFHSWTSRVGSLEQPDWVVLDLDPGERTPWDQTIAVACALRQLLELLELESVIKTSGQKGLHVLVPLAPGHTPEEAHTFAQGAAGILARLLPDAVPSSPSARSAAGGSTSITGSASSERASPPATRSAPWTARRSRRRSPGAR